MVIENEIKVLSSEIKSTQKILIALGDNVRQHLILVMMESGECTGMRVGDIAAKTHLSRPAVSHHLQIMKDAGIVKMRREGTRNYYYFDAVESFDNLIEMLIHAKNIMGELPDRSSNE